MRQVIDGKVYDTDTAEKLHGWYNGFYPSDFKYVEETLFVTRKGCFFRHAEGGPMSQWRTQEGNGWGGGEGIEILSKESAIRWLESHDGSDVLTSHPMFSGAIEEG